MDDFLTEIQCDELGPSEADWQEYHDWLASLEDDER
jgi:hypothetical protein